MKAPLTTMTLGSKMSHEIGTKDKEDNLTATKNLHGLEQLYQATNQISIINPSYSLQHNNNISTI